MTRRSLFFIIVWVIILVLPAMMPIYYTPFYYVAAVILFLIGLYNIRHGNTDETFYRKWTKQRSKGFWLYVAGKGLWSTFTIAVVVSLGQLFGNDYTPPEIVTALSTGELIGVLLLMMLFGFASAIASWFENNKRYDRVINKRMENK
ncbi:hypothetical protein FH966_04135 [Lentibacillus cibarius]|uniref:Uncharacterized protein n=1 Tax=Lentibacillus cibarius TaxID=2583219 RepID=A0A549YGF2_9BACI|nr:hypothetical protein [Lentibacillus cibarius]TRM10976.1 hypothetical protein FH966_04135 [Lentibacillus cibarius]